MIRCRLLGAAAGRFLLTSCVARSRIAIFAFKVGFHIPVDDAPFSPRTRDVFKRNAILGREPPRHGRRVHLDILACESVFLRGHALGFGGFLGFARAGVFRCSGALGFSLRDDPQEITRGNGLTGLFLDPVECAGLGGWNLQIHLVRFQLEDGLTRAHGLTHLLEPASNGGLRD